MTVDRTHEPYRAQPFQPFTVHLADGRQVPVKSPEFISFSPSGRTIAAHEPDDAHRMMNMFLVTEIHVRPNGSSSSQRSLGRR